MTSKYLKFWLALRDQWSKRQGNSRAWRKTGGSWKIKSVATVDHNKLIWLYEMRIIDNNKYYIPNETRGLWRNKVMKSSY